MKKTFFSVPLLVFVALAPAHAQKRESQTALPLRQVVLFSSGVGYFGRAGKVNGDAAVDLHFRAPQLSDILKSLVIFDPQGKVAPVTYSIADWMAAQTRETDLALDASASPGALLKALQGAMVELVKGPTKITGRVISVSTLEIRDKDGDSYRTVEAVTLLTADGVQTVRLDDVTSFSPLDAQLKTKFAASLEKRAANLTSQLDDGVRAVTLRFSGKGERAVRVGYLQETPTWKTSYRLVLAPKQKPYLQGWAIVENPTDEDWNAVQLSMVAGRPISFIQNLATPLYISRPVVDDPTLNSSPRPQTFGAGFSGDEGSLNARLDALEARPETTNRALAPLAGLSARHQTGVASFLNSGSYNAPAMEQARDDMAQAVNGARVEAQASGADKGDLFVYAIDTPITLPRGQAAMVPIVGQDVDGEAISIVQSQNQIAALEASNGFCLRNRGGLHLQGGPITVYNDGIYGGDAQISNVSPGESRLITYALDLDLTTRLDRVKNDSQITAIAAGDGVLTIKRRATMKQIYTLKNKSAAPKTVLIQQPAQPEWELVDAKQLYEKANEGWRFKTEVAAGKTLEYAINWTRDLGETIAIGDLNVGEIAFYAAQKEMPSELRAALQKLIELRKKAAVATQQRAAQEKTLAEIQSDQARIRENMRVLDQKSALYKTYATKLAAQEAQLEKIGAEIERLRTLETSAKQAVAAAF